MRNGRPAHLGSRRGLSGRGAARVAEEALHFLAI